jgi:hypothetical protein
MAKMIKNLKARVRSLKTKIKGMRKLNRGERESVMKEKIRPMMNQGGNPI